MAWSRGSCSIGQWHLFLWCELVKKTSTVDKVLRQQGSRLQLAGVLPEPIVDLALLCTAQDSKLLFDATATARTEDVKFLGRPVRLELELLQQGRFALAHKGIHSRQLLRQHGSRVQVAGMPAKPW